MRTYAKSVERAGSVGLRAEFAAPSPRTSGHYTYDVDRDWKTFETTVWLRDDTESQTVAQLEILADDVPVYTSGNISVGQSVPVSVSVDTCCNSRSGTSSSRATWDCAATSAMSYGATPPCGDGWTQTAEPLP